LNVTISMPCVSDCGHEVFNSTLRLLISPGLWREAYLHDPDGNVLCLYHAGNNRRFPPGRILHSNENA
jgi:hypothetical protein